jgi:PAS domain S-box-containing protein
MLDTPSEILKELERLRAENERLRQALAHPNSELSLLRNIFLSTSMAPNVDAALDGILHQIGEATGWPMGQAWVLSGDGTSLECSPAFFSTIKDIEKFRAFSENFRFDAGLGLPGRVWSSRRHAWIRDVATDSNFPRVHIALEAKLHSAIGFPVLAGEEVVAIIEFFAFESRDEDLPLIEMTAAVTAQIGSVIKSKLAEDALRQAREFLSSLLDHAPVPIYVRDADDRYRLVNRAWEEFTGKKRQQVIGQRPDIVHQSKSLRELMERNRRVIESGKPIAGEEAIERSDGTHYFHTVKFPLRDGEGRVEAVGGISIDITERKRLEQQLLQSQKMESVGRLAGGVAHEFNNLLTAILGYMELLGPKLAGDDPAQSYLRSIGQAANRGTALAQQLLAFARKQIIEPRIVNLNELMLRMNTILRRLIGEHIDLVALPSDGLGNVRADPGQLEQIVLSLAVNARDAMPNGGKLSIATANITLQEAEVRRYPAVKAGEYVLLTVSDTGTGMSDEVKRHLFEPFYTTKGVQSGGGTGLGLAMCYGIVKQNGGHIAVYSELGRGTSIEIYLPRVHAPAPRPAVDERMPQLAGTETILLVEDEPLVRTVFAAALRQRGFNILEAANGEEALRLAQEYKETIHLLVTDVVMPRLGGRRLAEILILDRPHVRTLFVSGYTENTVFDHSVLTEGVAFLQKPFMPVALVKKVREVLDAALPPKSEK